MTISTLPQTDAVVNPYSVSQFDADKLPPSLGKVAPRHCWAAKGELYQYWVERGTGTAYLIFRKLDVALCFEVGTEIHIRTRCWLLNDRALLCKTCGAPGGVCDCAFLNAMVWLLRMEGGALDLRRANLYESALDYRRNKAMPNPLNELYSTLSALVTQEGILSHQLEQMDRCASTGRGHYEKFSKLSDETNERVEALLRRAQELATGLDMVIETETAQDGSVVYRALSRGEMDAALFGDEWEAVA